MGERTLCPAYDYMRLRDDQIKCQSLTFRVPIFIVIRFASVLVICRKWIRPF